MEQLHVPKLLAGALAAVSGAVVASFFGIEGTLIGAALVSLLVAPAEALYTHSLASAHKVARRSLLRRVSEQAGASQEGPSQERTSQEATSQAGPQPIRWQRVAVAAVVAFGIAVGAITGVEAVANQPLASLVGSRPRPGASTSLGVVVAGADRSAPPATQTPATPTTSTPPSGPAPTTTAPVDVPTTAAPASTVPSTTAPTTTTSSTQAPTTQGP
jgi:hypothetical protein